MSAQARSARPHGSHTCLRAPAFHSLRPCLPGHADLEALSLRGDQLLGMVNHGAELAFQMQTRQCGAHPTPPGSLSRSSPLSPALITEGRSQANRDSPYRPESLKWFEPSTPPTPACSFLRKPQERLPPTRPRPGPPARGQL